MNNIKERIERLLSEMCRGAYEREEVIALSLLAAMAGESIFLLGLPGVGKSMVARRLKMAFKGATGFEYLMSRFSTPDEIFGPVSITKLKDEDTYERVTDGYLPTADVVFLDEIWKAGPAIQNSLLTALNERIFRNGNHDVHLPLKTIISASNELPAEGEGLEALWDRFLVRYIVQPISQRGAFLKLLTEKAEDCTVSDELTFTDEEFRKIHAAIDNIQVPDIVCNILCDIRDILSDEEKSLKAMPAIDDVPFVSDRRWRKIIGILRTSALLNGRSEVDASDCFLLENLLWDKDNQITSVRRLVADVIVNRLGADIPTSIAADDLEMMPFTEPVGDLLSPDGEHYVFTAGGEEVLIRKENYENLSAETTYGDMTPDNHLVVNKVHGAFTIKKINYGHIILNTFTYMLRRSSPIRTGSFNTMMKKINTNAERLHAALRYMIDENLFLRSCDEYPELENIIKSKKFTLENLRRK